MPLLDFADELPHAPRRVLVAGTSGAGKTTLAARISEVVDIPHIEIDGLYHGPGWTPRDSFTHDVERFSSGQRWVTEWQYSIVRPLLLERADLLVWLDPPHLTVMRQVIARTERRRRHREVLWNGNLEAGWGSIFTDREHIVRWAWSHRHATRERIDRVLGQRPDLTIVRLRSHDESARWLSGPLAATH